MYEDLETKTAEFVFHESYEFFWKGILVIRG